MKTRTAFILCLLALCFISCKDKEEMLPLTPLEGTWEYAFYNSDQNFFFIYQYIFDPSGTMEKNILVRESESPTILGYYSHSTGSYELRGEEYKEVVSKQYELALDAYLFYVPKDKLKETSVNASPKQTGKLTFSPNNRSFELLYPCNDTPSSNCLSALTYRRVDN
ncbi:hypothetical protein FHS59_002178 [Algoriphagus iocasae]|uniref:Lipocalin-like domain-containing protein n=1 Tax=Algoriphagus iocasae TaxID=1836499 RepID=A0A841MGR8_9BACT|nr:hypothetical protein [Algoriphagus iocasae]MBB6326550.1 hypothetical protein [Algoriphagus iocasae]